MDDMIELANQLGLAADRVFDIFVNAQQTTAIINSVLIITFIIVSIYTYKYISKKVDTLEDTIGLTAISMLGYIILLLFIYNILECIFLPEYTAARELICLLT